jgi:hypothetical protein
VAVVVVLVMRQSQTALSEEAVPVAHITTQQAVEEYLVRVLLVVEVKQA